MVSEEAYPLICSFYYDHEGDYYARGAERLRANCEELGIDSHIVRPPIEDHIKNPKKKVSRRNWICRYKPTFLYDTIVEFDRPILYIDVDCVILRKPPLYLFSMLHVGIDRQWNKVGGIGTFDVSAGAIYFNNTYISKYFISKWENRCRRYYMNQGDHFYLKLVARALCKEIDGSVVYFSEPMIAKNVDRFNPYIKHNKRSDECDSNNIHRKK